MLDRINLCFVHVFFIFYIRENMKMMIMVIMFGIWEAEKAMLVRFNPKTDLHVEAVKYDLRLSRANITLSLMSPPNWLLSNSSQLIRFSFQNVSNNID